MRPRGGQSVGGGDSFISAASWARRFPLQRSCTRALSEHGLGGGGRGVVVRTGSERPWFPAGDTVFSAVGPQGVRRCVGLRVHGMARNGGSLRAGPDRSRAGRGPLRGSGLTETAQRSPVGTSRRRGTWLFEPPSPLLQRSALCTINVSRETCTRNGCLRDCAATFHVCTTGGDRPLHGGETWSCS